MRMQFEDSEESYFFSQPHQPFFVLAVVNAIVIMLIFMLSYKGIINIAISSSSFHAYGLTFLLFTPAFFGFLFTTFPRFTSTPALKQRDYMSVFNFYYLGASLYILGSIVTPIFSALGMFLVFVGHTMGTLILQNIYKSSSMEDKDDVFWILLAMGFGLLSHGLFIIAQLFYPPLMGWATQIATYLFLFLLTFAVAQRMVPFFSHSMVGKNKRLLQVVFTLLLLHILLEGIYPNRAFIVDIVIGVLIGRELLRWNLQFPHPNPLLWVLHTALYWVPVAFILSGVTHLIALISDIAFLMLDIHTLMLGFVFTILIGFGTRVTLGHSGNMMQADKRTVKLFYGTQIVVALRILVSLVAAFGWDFMVLFDISATAWLLLFIAWAVRFFAVLINGKKLTKKGGV